MENNQTKIPDVVVVGDVAGSFCQDAADWLCRGGVGFTLTEDVYSATALIGQMDNQGKLLIVGTLEELSKEGMRFFGIAAGIGNIACCCLVQNLCELNSSKVAAAKNSGALIMTQFDDLTELLSSGPTEVKRTDNERKISLSRDDYALSEQELSALLEPR